MKWFRTWSSDYLTNPIITQLSLAQRGFYITLLSLASEQKIRGMISFGKQECCKMVARCLSIRNNTAHNMLQRLLELELIEIDQKALLLVVSDWNDIQFESDDATKRSREWRRAQRCKNVANRTEKGRKVSINENVPPPEFDGGDLERATQVTAPSPQSPDGQENPHGCAESLLEADKEMVERTEPGTDLLVAMATVVAEKYSYPEAVDDVLRCLANGKRPRNVWFSLLALLIDYDPICGQSPGTFFRKHLDSLPDSSPDDE